MVLYRVEDYKEIVVNSSSMLPKILSTVAGWLDKRYNSILTDQNYMKSTFTGGMNRSMLGQSYDINKIMLPCYIGVYNLPNMIY